MASALYNQALERAKKMKAAGAVSSRVQPQDKTGWDPERSDQFNQIRQKLRQQISSGNYVSDVTDADVGQFLQDVRTYAIDTEKQLTTGGWSGTMDPATSAARASTARDLNDREIKIRQWAGINKAVRGDEWYGEMVRYLDDFRKSQSIIDDEFKRSSEYYSQWDSQNAYDEYRNSDQYEKDIREAGYYQKYGQMSKQDINTAINSLPNGDEKQWLTDYYKTALRTVEDYDHEIAMIDWELGRLEKVYDDFSNTTRWVQDEADEQTNQKIERYRKNYGSPDAVKRRIKQLQTDRYDMEQGKKYNLLYQNDDYLENAQYAGKGTTLQDWVNDPEKADEQDTFGHVMRFVDPAVISPIMDALYYENVHLMTDDERRTFNYLHNTKGEAAAEEYMDWLQRALNTRSQQKRDSWVAERTKDIPVLSQVWTSMVSTPLRFMSAEGILDAAGQKIVNTVTGNDRPVDYNRDAMMFSRAGNTIRSSVSQQIADATHERVADAYNIAMSMQDSAAVAVATAVNPIAGKVASTLLSASAATDTMIAAADNGANDAQAITMGLAAGFFEWFFEKYEIESLLKQGKNVGTALLKQGFNEAVGESATELCNIVVNAYVMAENSDWYQNVEKHMAEHPEWDKSQAENAAMMDAIKQVLAAGTAGFVSGGIMGSGMAGINTVSGKIADRNDATAVAKDLYQSEAGRDRLMELAREIAAEQTGRSAKRMNSQIEKVGKEATLRNTRGLYRAVSDAYDGKTESDVVKSLTRKGFSKRDAAALGKALTAEATGGIIGPEESGILEKYQYDDRLRETRSNLLENEKSTVNQRRQNLSGLRVGAALDLQVQQLDMEQKAANRFTELGETENTEALSAAAAKAAAGQKLTAEEKKLLKVSEHSAQIVEELKTQAKEQPQTPAADNTAAPTETTTTAPQEASTEGVAVRKDTGAPVTIKEVAAIKDGRMTLRLEDGATIEAANVDFGSEAEAIIYETVAKLANHPKAANLLINAFKTGDVSAYDYAKGIIEAHLYGSFGLSEQDMLSRESAVKKLTPHQRKVAYEIGQIFAGREIAKKHAAVRRPKGSKVSVKEGKVHFDGERSKLNDTQKASLDAMEMLSKALGVQIYIFESKTDTDGTHTGQNGWYDLSDGSIHIDLNAGMDGKGTMLFTAAHELTHFIRQWSPAKFKVLANFLISQYYVKGVSVQELIDGQIAKAKRDNRTIDRDTAYEEVIADSMETMLTDGNVLQQLAELRQRDKTLWEKIREWFKDFANKLKAVIKTYDGAKPDSVEGRLVSDMKGVVEILEALYVDALTDASANYAAGAQKNTAGGGVKYQARPSAKNPNQLDPRTITRRDVEDILRKVEDGEYSGKTYVPVRISTPGIIQERLFVEDLPMVMPVFKIEQAMREDTGLVDGKNKRGHGFTTRDILSIIEKMDSPDRLYNQPSNNRGIAVINHETDDGSIAVVVEFDNNINPAYLNGYEGGAYNLVISPFSIDGGMIGLFEYAQKNHWIEVFNKKKEGDPAKKFPATRPFAVEQDSLADNLTYTAPAVKKKLSDFDADYMNAVNRGDMKTAQKMVDDAAKAAGYTTKAYHGTDADSFNEFDRGRIGTSSGLSILGDGFYFSDKRATANQYGRNVYSVYLKQSNPYAATSSDAYKLKAVDLERWGYDSVTLKAGKGTIFMVMDAEQIKSADPVTYDDEGNVIPLSQRFNSENTDIRYSTRDPAAQKLQQTLEKENAKLKEDVANLRELLKLQRTVTNGTKFTKTSVQAAAQWLKKSAGAKGDTKELVGLLNTFYEEIATSGTGSKSEIQLTWESLYDCAMPVVQWLQDHVDLKSERSEYAQNVLKQIRGNRIYLDESQKAEAAHRFGSFGNFRKSMMGSVTIVKDGNTSLDSFWQEMSATYPDIFNSETASGDMPGELFDIIGRLRNSDTSKVEYEYNRDLIAMDLLQDVYDSYWRVSAMRTFADTMQKKINVLRYKHRQQMSQLRSEKNAKIDSIKAEHRAELEQVRKEHRADTEAKVQDIRDKYTAARERSVEDRKKTVVKNKIKNFKKQLERELLRPTDKQYIPINLTKAMVDVCELIDDNSPLYKKDGTVNKAQAQREATGKKLLALADAYNSLNTKNKTDPVYTGEFDEMVYAYLDELRKNYSEKSLDEMSLDELREMYEILQAIKETLQDARKLIGWGDAEGIYEAGTSIIAEQRQITADRRNGKRNTGEKARDYTLNLSLSPVRNVERMSGYHQDSYLFQMFKHFEKGVRKKNKFRMDAYKQFEPLTAGKQEKQYFDAIHKEVKGISYVDAEGRKFGVSKMQMMQVILSFEREVANNMGHIPKGGFTFADLKLLSKGKLKEAVSAENAHRVSAAVDIVGDFVEALKDDRWCQDYMSQARTFFDGAAKDAVNETSLALKHRIIARDKNYIPFEVDKDFVNREISAVNNVQETINSYGMLKATKDHAPQPLIITGLNNILDRHIEQVGNLYGLGVEVRNFNKVWNFESQSHDTTVKNIIKVNWGNAGVDHIEQAVKDIQGPRSHEHSPLYDKVKGNYIGATFLLNLSVVTKQIGSMYSATSMLKWRDPIRMIGNLAYTMAMSKKISAEVDQYTASAWMRRQGMSDEELYTLMTQAKKPGALRVWSKAPALVNPAKWITAMDHAVALSLWKYAKIDTRKRTGLEGEELLKATAEFYDEVIENTQSMTDVLHRPEIQKRKNIMSEILGMFKTDLFQMAGQLQNSVGRFKAEPNKENAAALGKTLYATLSGAIWGQLMTTLWALFRYKVNPFRDEDDEELTVESWLKRQGFALVGDLAGYILPICGSEIVGLFERIEYGESGEAVESIGLSAINGVIDTIVTVGTAIKDGEMPKADDWKKIAIKCLQAFGVPANNIIRTYEAIRLHATDIANGEFLSFEAGVDRSPKHHVHRIIEAADAGNLDVARGLYDEAIEETAEDKAEKRAEKEGKEWDGSYSEDDLETAKSELKTALGTKFKDGEVDEATVMQILSEIFGESDNDIYWILDKWNYAKETGSSDGYSRAQQLYDAMVADDDEAVEELKSHFLNHKGKFSDTSYHSAIQKGLRENEPRIQKAAEAKAAGDTDTYLEIVEEIVDEGHFKWKDVTTAVKAVVKEMEDDEETDTET